LIEEKTVKNTSSRRIVLHSLAVAALAAGAASTAHAAWTVTNLHPPGAIWSQARGVSGSQQAGIVMLGGVQRASLWTGTAASWVDLHPAGAEHSSATGTTGAQQSGAVFLGHLPRASLWSGTAAARVDLHPAGATHSFAAAIAGTQQAGDVMRLGVGRASLWNGSAASWVDLHPAGSDRSWASGTNGAQQVGTALFPVAPVTRASLWSGSAASWVDLTPPGASISHGTAISGSQQVGVATFAGVSRAGLWSGTAASWVDLHPVGATWSAAYGTSGSHQVGAARFGGRERAGLWAGSAASWVDLHALLPGGAEAWRESWAWSVWSDGSTIQVVGWGHNLARGNSEALLWTWTPPPAANVSGSVGLGGWTAPLTGRPVTFEVRAPGSTTALQTAVVNLSAAGEFTFTTALPAGTYDVTAKSDRWLRARLQNVAFTAAGVSGLAFGELIPGDVVEDNAVDLGDFLALAATYEVVPPTEARADLNGDGAVDLADFLLLAAHYETPGAP
jgi:hypothetical protein